MEQDPTQSANAGKTFVILGTAPTWKLAPFADPQAVIAGLNDAYLLGLPRYDIWYDLHPFGQFFFRPLDPRKKTQAFQVPAGTFLRPEGHIQWLAKQTVPVFVQTADPRVPHAQVFPRPALEARFGPWIDSSPAWMLMHAIAMGFTKVAIYGIHLASEQEYIKQKPNMCYLIGLARGLGVDVYVPNESPLLHGSHRYAYERDPAVPVQQVQRDAQRLEAEHQAVAKQLTQSKTWYRPKGDPMLRSRQSWLQARLVDLQQAVEWETLKKRAQSGVA